MTNNTKLTSDNHPDFLTKDLLEKSLKNGFNTVNISITDYEMTMGSSPGENYLSDIYRCKIIYTKDEISNNKISLIIKAMPFVEARSEILDKLEMFDKELQMYMETIPKISKILDGEYMCARCFYAVKEPVQLIVFEDLKTLGFQMADRHSGIDEFHCRLVLRKLARFHAASMILAERVCIAGMFDSNYVTYRAYCLKEKHHMDRFSFGLFKPNAESSDLMDSVFVKGLQSCIDEVKTWTGYESIVKKLNVLSDDFVTKITNHCNTSPTSIKVLNHGDLWVNNFLFKYEEGRPVDVVFVDFQISFYTSPGYDINYFLSTSPTNDVREKKLDVLIDEYYNNFAGVLRNEFTEHFSVDDIKKEIRSREFYGFAASIGVTPIIMMDKDVSKDSNMEAFVDEEAPARLRKAIYGSKNYRKAMEFMLKKFDEHKVLENVW